MLPLTSIMSVMSNKTSSTREPQRVHLHAYDRLSRLCAEIQRGHYPTKAQLAYVVERSPRTVQNDLRALVNDFDAPLAFDPVKNGWYFTDPAWRLPSIALTQGELIGFFAAERMLRRLGASAEVQRARSALHRLGIHLRRDTWMSVMYAEGLNSAKSSVILQSTDRHGILGEKSADFQVPL